MSDRRKLGPVRQLSLQTDIRRPLLKKQLSVEHLESIEEHKLPGRNIESAKTNKLSDRPRPIRVAWAESRQSSKDEPPTPKSRFGDPVEIKKCKEHKRPVTAKLRTQLSVEKESILYTRQELAERLRKAWKDREENKQNLDIFLAHNVQEKHFDEDEPEVCYDKKVDSPKEEIVALPKPQKTIQKQKSVTSEFSYIPSTTANRPQDVRTNISVTIPIVINQKPQDNSQPDSLETKSIEPDLKSQPEIGKEPKLVKQTSLINKENESLIKTLPPRPSTAATKRENFQKRTNTAFSGSVTTNSFRPPLTRTLSVPVKSDGNKLKFIATKRRLKSARRKGKSEEHHSGEEGDEDGEKTTKKGSRCKSAPGGELVTMVSLVSPAGSDTEEQTEAKKEVKSRSASPVKSVEPVKTPALRKSVKSVSFQQSSIHAVRSFSASFPSRRNVMSAMSMGSATGAMTSSEREKRAPVESPPGLGETRGPKRRLVRAVSVAGDDVRLGNQRASFEEDSSQDERPKTAPEISGDPKQTLGVTRAEILPSTKKQNSIEKTSENTDGTSKEDKENDEVNDDPSIPKFESNKERDCWIMYKKMSEKGLPVSYDTILRGMLTPTEYRSVRKDLKSTS